MLFGLLEKLAEHGPNWQSPASMMAKLIGLCKQNCLQSDMPQVQVRVPDKLVETVDEWVKEGKFKSRSDAIRTVLSQYEEKERTREFYEMLKERSEEAREHPEKLTPLE